MATKKITEKSVTKKSAAKKPAADSVVKKTTAKTAKTVVKSAVKPAVAKAKAAPKPTTGAIIDKYQTHEGDTGSTQVQIARISLEIDELSSHLKKHPKDHDSRRGLLIMVGKRRRLLNYLKRQDESTYQSLIVDLKLRK